MKEKLKPLSQITVASKKIDVRQNSRVHIEIMAASSLIMPNFSHVFAPTTFNLHHLIMPNLNSLSFEYGFLVIITDSDEADAWIKGLAL